MMNNVIKFLGILVMCLCSAACEKKCEICGFEIGYLLISKAETQGIDYCELAEKSFQNDHGSIRKLCSLHFEDTLGYEHGELMVRLVLRLGEQQFIDALGNLGGEGKSRIRSYLDVGLEYGAPDLKNKDLREAFPKLNSFLN